MRAACQEMLKAIPLATWAEGDVMVCNDPYRGCTHTPDIVLFSGVRELSFRLVERRPPLLVPGLNVRAAIGKKLHDLVGQDFFAVNCRPEHILRHVGREQVDEVGRTGAGER